jgi:hypothetical protein
MATEYTECQALFPFVGSGRSPPPHPQVSVAPPPLYVQEGRHTRLQGRGWGDPNSDEGTDTLILYVPSKMTAFLAQDGI